MELVQGARLGGRFKVVSSLGTRESGGVFLAVDGAHDDCVVTLRTFPAEATRKIEARERIRRRVKALYSVHHPGLVPVKEFVDELSFSGCVLEQVKGKDLPTYLQTETPELPEIIAILNDLASAISALHAVGIVYGDLEPSDIIVTENGVKLIPGGFLRQSNSDLSFKLGLAQYRAPEFLRDGDADQRADLYALGVIGLELLAKQTRVIPEFKDSTAVLKRFLTQSTHADPEARFHTAAELQAGIALAGMRLGKYAPISGNLFVSLAILYFGAVLVGTFFLFVGL